MKIWINDGEEIVELNGSLDEVLNRFNEEELFYLDGSEGELEEGEWKEFEDLYIGEMSEDELEEYFRRKLM